MADNATVTNKKSSFDNNTNPDIQTRAVEKSALKSQVVIVDFGGAGAENLTVPDFATEATLSTLNGKVTACNTGAVVISSSALPTGAATEATLTDVKTAVTETAVSLASSDNTPITTATDTTVIAAVPGQKHRIYYINASNGGAVTTDVMFRDGAAGTRRYRNTLPQNGIFSHAMQGGYWELSTNTALVLTTSAAGSVHYTVEYKTV